MNRICIIQDDRGDITGICADEPIEVYFVNPHLPQDRVYLYSSADFGPQHVRAAIGGYSVGHADDDVFGGSAPRLPPSKPHIRAVED